MAPISTQNGSTRSVTCGTRNSEVFATNSAEILPASNEILDAVAETLKVHPEFVVIEVAGHADERGSFAHNNRLTQERAAAVVDALRARGIAPERLISQGYGEYCPLQEGSTPEAWEKNRRVEFKVVKSDEGETDVERGCLKASSEGIKPPPIPGTAGGSDETSDDDEGED